MKISANHFGLEVGP